MGSAPRGLRARGSQRSVVSIDEGLPEGLPERGVLRSLAHEFAKFDLFETSEALPDEAGAERVLFGVYAPRLWAWMR